MRRTKGKVIRQAEIKTLIGYDLEIERINKKRAPLANEILMLLIDGGVVESGPHVAEVIDELDGGVLKKKLRVR